MSVATDINTPGRLIALCKEYGDYLARFSSESVALIDLYVGAASKFPNEPPTSIMKYKDILQQQKMARQTSFFQVQSGIQELIRAMSQQIEHASLEFEDRLELKVRLADLQGRLWEASQLAMIGFPD